MTNEEVERLLNDPFATLVLRAGRFPNDLGELLQALDEANSLDLGVSEQTSFVVSEGGQIPFSPGVDKGGTRLLTVRSRRTATGTSPELIVSTLIPPGKAPRSQEILNEVLAWDPVNRTFHFYQRQQGAWFWCGQSDMALQAPTRGKGPFDSHVNGYPLMKELKSPWVHWSGPDLKIVETAYGPDDPLVSDPLFGDHDLAFELEEAVLRPLIERWNTARFDKSTKAGTLTSARRFLAQVLEGQSANLISTHTQWKRLPADDLQDLPVTFFYEHDTLADSRRVGLEVEPPTLSMTGSRYKALAEKHNLRVRGESLDEPGDVPFCFTVPERPFEDVLVAEELIQRGAMSKRLAACLLMIDFANPVESPRRAQLMRHVPDTVELRPETNLDTTLVPLILEAAEDTEEGSAEREFAAHWQLGPTDWVAVFTSRIVTYLGLVAATLNTDEGCDAIFRLAESRRREFRRRPLAEFGLTLPQAVAIPQNEPPLEMTEQATVTPRN